MIEYRVSWLNMVIHANRKDNFHRHRYPKDVCGYSMVWNECLIMDCWIFGVLVCYQIVERNKAMFYLSHVRNESLVLNIDFHLFVFDYR